MYFFHYNNGHHVHVETSSLKIEVYIQLEHSTTVIEGWVKLRTENKHFSNGMCPLSL